MLRERLREMRSLSDFSPCVPYRHIIVAILSLKRLRDPWKRRVLSKASKGAVEMCCEHCAWLGGCSRPWSTREVAKQETSPGFGTNACLAQRLARHLSFDFSSG